MFCPSCGTESNEQTKYCTKCGVNLRRVQGVLSVDWQRATAEDWLAERDAHRKRTPEEKRLNGIKAGVITSSVGLGVMIFLYFLFDAIAELIGGPEREIIRAIPFVGIIPFLIGLGIIINGLLIDKRIVELKRRQEPPNQPPAFFPVANTTPVAQLVESTQPPINDFSIAEPTTKTLRDPVPVTSSRDTH